MAVVRECADGENLAERRGDIILVIIYPLTLDAINVTSPTIYKHQPNYVVDICKELCEKIQYFRNVS